MFVAVQATAAFEAVDLDDVLLVSHLRCPQRPGAGAGRAGICHRFRRAMGGRCGFVTFGS